MSGPNRLAGRCHQARSPQSTYETVIQTERDASTSGSPSSLPIESFVSAKASDDAAAAPPARATAPRRRDLGGAATSGSTPAGAAMAMVAPSPPARFCDDTCSLATARSVVRRTRMKKASPRGYSSPAATPTAASRAARAGSADRAGSRKDVTRDEILRQAVRQRPGCRRGAHRETTTRGDDETDSRDARARGARGDALGADGGGAGGRE